MDKTHYILKNIYQLHKIAGRYLDKEGKILTVPFEGFEEQDPVFCSPHLYDLLMDKGRNGGHGRYRVCEDDGYWYYVFYNLEQWVIWGPVEFEEHSKYQRNMYIKKRGVEGGGFIIPLVDIRELEKAIRFAHGLLFDQYGKQAVIDYGVEEEQIKRELRCRYSEKELQNAEWDRQHHSFIREQQMWKWLLERETDIEEWALFHMEADISFEDMEKGVGIMSESPKKNKEYAAVVGITLITRYAIAEGMDEGVAYTLSDMALQELSKAGDVVEMDKILDRTFREFIRRCREAKEKSQNLSFYVKQSQEYIARHIFDKLSLQEIAGEIGLHPVYLSRIFASQTGITLMEYVMQEKIRISCNLLKYSNRPIAIIAEYINLSPQSYFTRIFKKVMGETPAQYRKTHMDKNFIES